MTELMLLPNEIVLNIVNKLDVPTLEHSIAAIPDLRSLLTLKIDNVGFIRDIIEHKRPIAPLFQDYHFIEVAIDDFAFLEDLVYYRLFKVLKTLVGLKKCVKVDYLLPEIDINYLKMFKSIFKDIENTKKYQFSFPNITKMKLNSNHLLLTSCVSYPNLTTLNLYYCSANFYFQIFDHLNTKKWRTFPQLKLLKIQDYMSESEDVYSKTSDNHITEDYDDFDYNSDMDENEFYFDGLEILSNFPNITTLESLVLKNLNLSMIKNFHAPNLKNLKIICLNDHKHIDSYDLVDEYYLDYTNSKATKTSSNALCLLDNDFRNLKNLIIVGDVSLKKVTQNRFNGLENVLIKASNAFIDNELEFQLKYEDTNDMKRDDSSKFVKVE